MICEKQTTVTYRVCDECGSAKYKVNQCFGCGKDICSNCGEWLLNDPFFGCDYGDNAYVICAGCSEKFQHEWVKLTYMASNAYDAYMAERDNYFKMQVWIKYHKENK